jgi:hypothetical protein
VTCAEQRHCRASSGSPANLIADPLGTDGEDKHDERSKGDPKIGKKVSAVSINVRWSGVLGLSS